MQLKIKLVSRVSELR